MISIICCIVGFAFYFVQKKKTIFFLSLLWNISIPSFLILSEIKVRSCVSKEIIFPFHFFNIEKENMINKQDTIPFVCFHTAGNALPSMIISSLKESNYSCQNILVSRGWPELFSSQTLNCNVWQRNTLVIFFILLSIFCFLLRKNFIHLWVIMSI